MTVAHRDGTTTVAVRFDGVTRRFGPDGDGVVALDGVDLSIPRGEIFGVIGHSGAGKSTLIRLVNALDLPTEGSVHVDGVDLAGLTTAELRTARKRTGMIFQQFQLLETVTVLDNVAMPLRLDGVGRAEAQARATEALEFVGLGGRLSAYPGQLSGGQKQRVGIARAIIRQPAVLLCDEATSALDPSTTLQIIDLLRRVNEQYGTTILVVTHEMDVIKDLCHTVAVMEGGRVVEQGSVMDVFVQPRTPIARAFVGTVIPQELPERVLRAVGGHPLWRLRFLDEEVTTPIVGALVRDFGLEVNILHADMTDIRDRTVGHMIIQVEGAAAQRDAAFSYLAERIVSIEEVRA
ncbi:ATP-binding cassette domain-containing protein [Microbacterium sp. M28]|uniref:methionine ABC transporter ATP-binding protein n=1 Tax=Microbacterium sp. M28 TaxID=2962064 RepID=UPI0021F4EA2E|nr:ATP-binding cassette domain-containing protein [Microbacterium sp. M28]UYO98028.1 ATP-binding cassette domain-containing protein [Microbacterium sp. M28]